MPYQLIQPSYPEIIDPGRKPPFGTPLNRSHPLAQGMAYCFTMAENSGNILYNTGFYNHPDIGVFGSVLPTWVTTTQGSSLYFGSTATNKLVKLGPWPGYAQVTVATTFISQTAGSNKDIASHYDVTAGTPIWRFYRTSANVLKFIVYISGAGKEAASTSTFSDGQYVHAVGVHDGVTNNIYINGKCEHGLAASGSPDSTASIGILGGATNANYANVANDWLGNIINFYLWNRALSSSEISSLYIDPYQMFRSSMPYWFWSGTAEVTGTIEGSFDRLTGSLTIAHGVSGSIAGSTDRLSGSITNVHGVTGTVAGTLDRLSTSIDGVTGYVGTLTGSLLRLGGSLSGATYELVSGTIEGELDELTGQFTGTISIDATINGELDRLTGSVSGRYGSFGRKNLYIELEIGV